jgi:sulfite exporter TauE/SafE
MLEFQSIYNGYTALVAGLVTSVHCVAMCGPLACAFTPSRTEAASAQLVLTCYHLSKMVSYALVGALAGAFGSLVIRVVEDSWLNYLPWILALFFLGIAFRLDRFLPKPLWLGQTYQRCTRKFSKFTKPVAASLIGFASPLLPCGPLYVIFGLALFSGSLWKGIEFAVGFSLGTLPLLWLAQSQFFRISRKIKMDWLSRFQRGMAFVAALVVVWRLRTTFGIEGTEGWMCW